MKVSPQDRAVKVDPNTGLIERSNLGHTSSPPLHHTRSYIVYAISLANKFKCKAFCTETRFIYVGHTSLTLLAKLESCVMSIARSRISGL